MLGLKIVVAVAVFMLLLPGLFLYLNGYGVLGAMPVWALGAVVLFTSFVLLMLVLSWMLILPLKRFELHMHELEKGRGQAPFVLNRSDELGYLAYRFNNLQKALTNRIEVKDAHLTVMHDFTNAAQGVFDVETLMGIFFRTLVTVVKFEAGGYLISYQNHTEGRIYSRTGTLSNDDRDRINAELVKKASDRCNAFPMDKAERLGVETVIFTGAKGDGPLSLLMDAVVSCYGKPVGVIMLFSSARADEPEAGAKVLHALAAHAGMVLERLFTHIFAEERRLTSILASMSEAVYFMDKEGRATAVNKKGTELMVQFCYAGLDCAALGPVTQGSGCAADGGVGCELSAFFGRLRLLHGGFDGKLYTEEIRNRKGISVLVAVSNLLTEDGRYDGNVITAKDVTEERRIQKSVMLTGKLAALGEMAAGIAHEVNNPLQIMLANVELLSDSVTESGLRRLEGLREGVHRVKGIMRDILIFAREQTTEVEDVDLNPLIEGVAGMFGRQFRLANIAMSFDLDRRSLVVRANRNLLQQVMINLLQNAKDALEGAVSGVSPRVSIRTVLLPGGIVIAEVSDNGPGIDEKVMDRIFDPFFTTKEVGKGTGLGLSISRRIIVSMGGTISVASSKSIGTRFTMSLLHNRDARRKAEEIAEAPTRDYSLLQSAKLLIVDDEDGLVRSITEAISGKVAEIDTAEDGKTALDIIRDKDYDIFIFDIKMPGMSGMELYRKVKALKPYLAERVIFMTGDTENEATSAFLKLSGCGYLSKPFTIRKLLDKMCEYQTEGA
ncbi:MAG: response regulator [Deltaproteobacteria bacterium]|nr:response regulator [Deltaproteobacteria bacterium]